MGRPHSKPSIFVNDILLLVLFSVLMLVVDGWSQAPTDTRVNSSNTGNSGHAKTNDSSSWGSGQWSVTDGPILNPHSHVYLHNPRHACHRIRTVDLLIAVAAAADDFQSRQAVRETWGSYASDPSHRAILLFFLGIPTRAGNDDHSSTLSPRETRTLQVSINQEASLHQDIVQETYFDTYTNLTLKSMSILKWAQRFCLKASYIIKADNDIYVVMPRLARILRETRREYGDIPFILGQINVNVLVNRDSASKFFMSPKEYQNDTYPNYANGPLYAMTSRAIGPLFQVALRTPQFVFEDVFITGVCASIAGIPLMNDNRLRITNVVQATGCSFKVSDITASHSFTSLEIRRIHYEFHYDRHLGCSLVNWQNVVVAVVGLLFIVTSMNRCLVRSTRQLKSRLIPGFLFFVLKYKSRWK